MCSDYVTEKLFNMYEDVDVIPVVRGGATYRSVLLLLYLFCFNFIVKSLRSEGKSEGSIMDRIRMKTSEIVYENKLYVLIISLRAMIINKMYILCRNKLCFLRSGPFSTI